mmetsp:Transcript_90561/g.173655  ORF Transcript_90561/g.173655 Transcript_90561/m.173655 type:complete len:402 (-) Transcript_90561:68-1273(-)
MTQDTMALRPAPLAPPACEKLKGEPTEEDETTIGSSKSSQSVSPVSIRWVTNFNEMYVLGKDVMTSGHDYMKIRFAERLSDGVEVVIKIQSKPCFKNDKDEKQWRECTEYLMNMPEAAGVLKLFEVLEDSKAFYIVMEKVDGMDLHQLLEECLIPVYQAKEILVELLTAMAHLHAQGAVHKDLKLENVMVSMTPRNSERSLTRSTSGGSNHSALSSKHSLKVIDFDTLEKWTPTTPPAKRGTPVVGTNQYIAQEAYAGKYSPASDVFAIGVIAYMLLTSKWPFPDKIFDDEAGENWVGSAKMHRIRCRMKKVDISFSHPIFREYPEAKDLIRRMLSSNEQDRPTAAGALEHKFFDDVAKGDLYTGNSDMFPPLEQKSDTIVEDVPGAIARGPFSWWCGCTS